MENIEDLRKETFSIIKIYLSAKENFNFCYYLHKPDTKIEAEYLMIDRNLKFIRHSLWRLSIIELAKLFSDRKSTHKFNLLHFLSKLRPEGHYKSFKIDPLKILEWERLIYTNENLIKDIITLRDKIYAHTDPNKEEYNKIEIYFTQIEELFEIVEILLKEVFLIAFSATLDLRTPTFERNSFDLVKILAQEHNRKIEEIRSLFKIKEQ
jgi:hypothetical protein